MGEAEASSAVLCAEGAFNSLSGGKGRGREARGRRREWKGWVKELGGGDVKKKKRVTEGGEEGRG